MAASPHPFHCHGRRCEYPWGVGGAQVQLKLPVSGSRAFQRIPGQIYKRSYRIAAHGKGLLKLPGDLARLGNRDAFRQWLFHTVPREWVVYSKPPFSGPEDVVRYIGRHTHSTAISNNRIIGVEDNIVTFWFKNTRKKCRWETITLPVMEFINRFLCHVLPKHFHRIRYYGFLANGKAGKHILSIRQALGDLKDPALDSGLSIDKACQCPACGSGIMMTVLVLDGFGNVVKDACSDTEAEHGMTEAESP